MIAPRVAAPAGSPTARGIWAVVVLGLVEGLDRGGGIGAHRNVRDVDVLVLHLHEAEILLGLSLAGSGELGDRAAYATLRLCRPASSIVVGIALEAWPPVLEYTSVSMTRILTFLPAARTRSSPPTEFLTKCFLESTNKCQRQE